MACGYVAVNDIDALCGTTKFKTCSISFRKKLKIYPNNKILKLSQLTNIHISKHKDQILCYCDDFIVTVSHVETTKIEEERVDPSLEDEYLGFFQEEICDLKNEREETYEREKNNWINRFSKNENIIEATKLGYSCDEDYCKERLEREWPGFFLIDESTIFWQCKCPSLHALKIEKRIATQTNSFKSKYGTYTRIFKLEKHSGINYDDCEAIVIFNYLGKFDVIAIINQLDSELYSEGI